MKDKLTKQDMFDLEVSPFTRLVWNSTEARDKYEVVVNRALPMHDKSEYEMVRQGVRRCGTLHLTPFNFHRYIERFEKDGIVWLPIQWTKNYGGFSHKHFPTVAGDPDSSVYGVIARNLEDAEEFRRASAYMSRGSTDHNIIGDLLGFPKCCSNFFIEQWDLGFYDPVWHSAEKTKGAKFIADRIIEVEGDIFTNQLLRYVGLRITSHFPCSMDCKDTTKVGKEWLEVKKSIDQTGADYLVEILSMPIVWSCLHGIATIETPIFTIITNSLPTKERWTVLHNVKGGEKPIDTMTLLEADVDLPAIAKKTKKQIETMYFAR